MRFATSAAIIGLAIMGLSACSDTPSKTEIDKLDAELAGKGSQADPALTAALEDQIMVDPSLSNQANTDSIRPADEPVQAPIPPEPKPELAAGTVSGSGAATASPTKGAVTLGQLAEQQAGIDSANFKGCGLDVDYSMAWSNRLPGDLPLYPKARVAEAAGSNKGSCALRAVTYTASVSPSTLVEYYKILAKRSGYTAESKVEGSSHVVAGTRGQDAYYVIVSETTGGTSADFVANNGS
jgi:hypothetical protein